MSNFLLVISITLLAIAGGVLLLVWISRLWIRKYQRERIIWHEKRAIREDRQLDKYERRKARVLMDMIAMQTAEQQAVSELREKDQTRRDEAEVSQQKNTQESCP